MLDYKKNILNINVLPNPELIKALYKEYFTAYREKQTLYSSHWSKYSRNIHVGITDRGRFG